MSRPCIVLLVAALAAACGPTEPTPHARPVAAPVAPPPRANAIARAIVSADAAEVRTEPTASSSLLGFVRRGARFDLVDRREDGSAAWWKVRDAGWVRDVSLRTKTDGEPRISFVPAQPRLDRAMPYAVGRVLGEDGAPAFRRPPRDGEDEEELVARHLAKGYFFTIDRMTSVRRRPYFRGINYWFIPRDATTTSIIAPTFEGIEVTSDTKLPFLWVTDPTARLCAAALAPEDAARARCTPVERHSRIPYDDETRVAGGVWYRSGSRFIARLQVARVVKVAVPSGVGPNERWIHVDLRNQFAALYEGETMRFVTLISSGDDEHPTPKGTFRIASRHVTATMDGEENPSGPYFIQDVPWVMFFHQGYALHAAFWHDRFGLRTSHGCVNLSPSDAKRFFEFATEPSLPPGLHAVFTQQGQRGTLVHLTN